MEEFQQLAVHAPTLIFSPDALSVAAGCFAFGSSLAVSTLAQWKILGVSTGTIRPIPTVLGMVTVCAASLASHRASIMVHQAVSSDSGKYKPRIAVDSLKIGNFKVSKQAIQICALGLLSFKLLGGRFWAIAPSSYTHVGSFARASIPATENYATQAQRSVLKRIGRNCGCHTCGTRIIFGRSVIGDHQPPKAVARQLTRNFGWRKIFGKEPSFRFYPQCVDCSQMQGSILSAATRQVSHWWNPTNLAGSGGGRAAHFHGLKFRLNHLAGAVVAATTVIGATEKDIATGNRRRYEKLQRMVVDVATPPTRTISSKLRNVL